MCSNSNSSAGRVRYAIINNISMIDVDESYHVRKYEQLRQVGMNVVTLGPPSLPQSLWIAINEANYMDKSPNIPKVFPRITTYHN